LEKRAGCEAKKRYTGPEGPFFYSVCNAALEGPLFHGTIDGMARRAEFGGDPLRRTAL